MINPEKKIGQYDFYLTDHAVLRYLERNKKLFDLKEVRKEIRDILDKHWVQPNQKFEGFVVSKVAIITYINPNDKK